MPLTRRRFLTISAAAVGLAASPASAQSRALWNGVALGAPASLQLRGIALEDAAPIFAAVELELARLEQIFSLYRPTSALSRLNKNGFLAGPPPDLLAVLSMSDQLHNASDGAFDPTVQPLFDLVAQAATNRRTPTDAERAKALARVGWGSVKFQADQIKLMRPGAALTLNGIAQGYVTDQIATLLRAQGLTDVLVDMGEVRGLGGPWHAGVRDGAGQIVKRMTLTNSALATSAPFGSQFGSEGHIFSPVTGTTSNAVSLVSVIAPTAALADGLSTTLAATLPARHDGIIASFQGAAILYRS